MDGKRYVDNLWEATNSITDSSSPVFPCSLTLTAYAINEERRLKKGTGKNVQKLAEEIKTAKPRE